MASENHILNIIARLRDDASKGVISLNKNVDKLTSSLGDLTKSQNRTSKATDDLTKSQEDLENQIKFNEGQFKRINKEIEKHTRLMNDSTRSNKDRAKSFDALNRSEQELNKNTFEHASLVDDLRVAQDRLTTSTGGLNSSLTRARQRFREAGREAEKDEGIWRRFAFTTDENSKSVRRLEQRLARLGRAMLGLGVASVIVFMQSFMSAITAVVGEVINLAGSLTFAAGALGGTFVAAIAQAIPMLGIFAAALQRISVIQNAVTQHNLIAKQSAGEATQAAEAQAAASDAVAEAQRNVVEAQKALTEARKEGRLEIEDLIAAEREAQLAAERAVLSQRDAKWALQDAIQGGDVAGIRSAQLDVQESALERSGSKTDLQRARSEANKARRGGVDSLDSVKAASKALADANRALAQSHEQAAQAANDQSAAENSLKYFLDQLSPAEKELYKAVVKFQEDFKKLFSPITDVIIESLTRSIGKVRELITDPAIVNGFKNLAEGMSGAIDKITNLLTNDRSKEFWTDTLKEGARNLKPLTEIASELWRIFRNIAEAAAPVLHKLLKLIGDELGRWADATRDTKGLTKFFETGLEHLRAWYGLGKALFQLFAAVFGISSKEGIKSVEGYTKRIQDATKYVEEHHEEVRDFFKGVRQAFEFLIDMVVSIGGAFVTAFDPKAVEALSTIVDEVLVPGLTMAVEMTGKIAIALADLAKKEIFGHSIGEILAFVLALKIVTGSISLLAGLLGGIAGPIRVLVGYLIQFGSAIGFITPEMLTAEGGAAVLAGRLAALAGIIGIVIAAIILFRDNIINGLQDAWESVGPSVKKFIGSFKRLYDTIDHLFGGSLFKNIFDRIGKIIEDTFENVGQILSGVIDMISGFLDLIDDLLHGRWGEIWGDLKGIVGGALKAVLGVLDQMTQPFEEAGKIIGNAFAAAFNLAIKIAGEGLSFLLGGLSTILSTVNTLIDKAPGFVLPPGAGDLGNAAQDAADKIDSLRESITGEGDESEKADNKISKHAKTTIGLGDVTRNAAKESENLGKQTKKTAEEHENAGKSAKGFDSELDTLKGSIKGTAATSIALGTTIADVTNSVLKGFGADEIKFAIPGTASLVADAVGKGADSGKQHGGIIRAAYGAIVPGSGSGDKVPLHLNGRLAALVEPGELVSVNNRTSTAQLMQHNRDVPRRAGGGTIPGVSTSGMHPGILRLASFLTGKYPGLSLSSGLRPGDDGFHGQGLAADLSDGTGGSAFMNRVAAAISQSKIAPTLLEGIHQTGLSWDSGSPVPPSFWGASTWASHIDHIHLAIADTAKLAGKGLQAVSAALETTINPMKIKVKGPEGHLRDMLQAQSDKLSGVANKELGGQAGMGITAGGKVPKSFQRYNHSYEMHMAPDYSGETLPFNVVAAIAEWAGLPGIAFAQIAKGESGMRPGSAGTDPGGTHGYGLWAITDGFNDELIARLGGPKAMLNPIINARAAKEIYNSQGIGAWYGTSYLTDPTAHYTGRAIHAKQGGQIPWFGSGGSFTTHSPMLMGVGDRGPEHVTVRPLQGGGTVDTPRGAVSESFSTIKDQLYAIASIQDGSFGKIIEGLTALLREGGPFDDLGVAIEEFTTFLTNKMTEWLYRIRKGVIGQIRTSVEIANQELDNLEEIAKQLDQEMKLVQGAMNQAKARLKEIAKELRKEENKKRREELKDQRDELRTIVENINDRIEALDTAIAENLASRYEAQNAVFDALIARFDQKLSKNDLLRQIQEARNQLTPDESDDTAGIAPLLEQRGRILRQEQRSIQREMEKARKAHNKELFRELQQALLENRLAQIENTGALKDLTETTDKTNEIFSFNSTAWDLFRMAIFTGTGQVLPQFAVPHLASGGTVTRDGMAYLHAAEVVTPADGSSGDNNIYFTQPMEVADPEAISSAIAWKLKQQKV